MPKIPNRTKQVVCTCNQGYGRDSHATDCPAYFGPWCRWCPGPVPCKRCAPIRGEIRRTKAMLDRFEKAYKKFLAVERAYEERNKVSELVAPPAKQGLEWL